MEHVVSDFSIREVQLEDCERLPILVEAGRLDCRCRELFSTLSQDCEREVS